MNKKIGVILSGCGRSDGSEIHETVLTILALDKSGAKIIYMAPDIEFDVIDPITNNTFEQTGSLVITPTETTNYVMSLFNIEDDEEIEV